MVENEPSHSFPHSLAPVLETEGDMSKPLMVRIKRKRLQLPIDSLWLEVSERPTKRLEAEFLSFSLNNSYMQGSDAAAESESSRLLFHHVDTVSFFGREETTRREIHDESSEEKHRIWPKRKEVSRKARFEQVWRSRKGVTKQDTLSELFHVYDIVRVDLEADILHKQEREAENRLLQKFLPLFKEYLPSAATEVESSTASCTKKEEDDYVYDVYALGDKANGGDMDTSDYPMYDEYSEGEDDSEEETDMTLSRSEVAERKHYVVSDASDDYGCDAEEDWKENLGYAGYDSDDE